MSGCQGKTGLKHQVWGWRELCCLTDVSIFFPLPDEDVLVLDLLDEDFLVVAKLNTLAFFGLGTWINEIKKKMNINQVKHSV